MENRVDDNLKSALSAMPSLNLDNLEQLRKSSSELILSTLPVHDSVSVLEHWVPGSEGAPDVRVRIYRPIKACTDMPGVLWIHGGGFMLGSPEMNEGLCQRFVTQANCIVVSVDYRLAPENPFPAPLEDCYAALKWFHAHADDLGVDASRLAIAGASAGGGLTAALALLARDRQGPPIKFQMPLYPMIDDRNITPSSHEITDARVWNRESNLKGWAAYLGTNREGDVSQYAAPSRATDLSNLPPAYTCVGDLDPFRDETIDYVARLARAGVSCEFHLYPGCFHGFESMVPQAEVSRRAISEYVQALQRALER
ncbi:alpha/beta hydrolase [Alicyclobacillus fastidiosus]|uniref:Alpha/beta hydrolase n=1 Tax=Alicyclobacillus fastidiosus TaxID=392011 RepID=A0ABY6ZLN1_9BACL|nr:alpha/beta hydrolase [Alicyclobacillus fastidiosus]WAH43372.1 alpha/beta hydrolase [Alicyclobacillus fastidiosus]GMA65433.1 esterase [Alicyclobacillus fastidiosus]